MTTSKYLTANGSIDTAHLLRSGLKPSEVRHVFCTEIHSSGRTCAVCGFRVSHAAKEGK